MKIETQFGIGDVVWKAWAGNKKVWQPCDFCGTTGQIVGHDETLRTCPECSGRKGKNEWLPRKWMVSGPYTVGMVSVAVAKDRRRDEERYMCEETGIGSGTNYRAEDLFTSEASAQEACDKQNKRDGKKGARV